MAKHQLNLAEELKNLLSEYSTEILNKTENGLNKAAVYLVDEFKKNTPVGSEMFEDRDKVVDSWITTVSNDFKQKSSSTKILNKPYKCIRYIGNSATASRGKNKNIPIVNLLEFSKNGKPFIRKTFEVNKEKIIGIIKGEIENAK